MIDAKIPLFLLRNIDITLLIKHTSVTAKIKIEC